MNKKKIALFLVGLDVAATLNAAVALKTGESHVVDFGPEGVGGYPSVTFAGTEGSARIRLAYATHPDGLGPKGDFWHETRAHYMGWNLWLPILPANTDRFDVFEQTGAGTWRAPLAQGLVRYAKLTVESGAATVKDVTFVNDGIHSEEPVVGSFHCSDERVNGVWRASIRTCQLAAIPARTKPLAVRGVHTNAVLGTTYAYLSDGAKRDRLVWSGDLWFAQGNMYAAFASDSPYMPGSIRMLAENRTPDGYVQACPFPESHGPLKAGDYGPFASDEFAAWFIPVLCDHVLHTGDLDLAREMRPVVRDLVAYLDRHTAKDGIFEQRLETCKHSCGLAVGGTSLHHRSYMNVLNGIAYRDAAQLATWLGDAAEGKAWTALADRTAKAVRREFWDAEKGHFRLSREERKMGFEANALALAAKFATPEEARRILPQLVRNGHGKFQLLAVRGAFAYGQGEKAMELVAAHNWYKYLEPEWKGLRTVQECCNLGTKGWGDEAHPDACLAGVFTEGLLGVEPLEPGYRTFRVTPHPTKSVTSASGRVPTPYGPIRVAWRLVDGKLSLDVQAPEGTQRVEDQMPAATPELEVRRLDPNAKYAKPEFKAATEAQYKALVSHLDAEGVAYRVIGPDETPRACFVLHVNEKEVQEMHGIGTYGKPVEVLVKDIRRRLARMRPAPVVSERDADELQRLADAVVGTTDRTLVLERGKTYRLSRPLRLDVRHSGLVIEGNGAVVEAGRLVTGWRAEGNLLVADVADWDGEILSLWVNGRRAQLAQAPNGERARMRTGAPKALRRSYPFDPKKDGVSVAAKDIAGVLASSEEELADGFVDYTIAWFTPKCRLVQAYDNGDGTANLFARNVACLHGTGKPDVRYVPFNFGPYEKAWSGEAGAVVSNLRRLLDAPGEFFFDRKARKLLYLPREGEAAANMTAHFATLERALEIVGGPPAARVRDVTIRNVVFRHGRQDRNAPDGFAPASQAAAKCGGFLHVANAENVRLEGIRVEHCDVYGVAFAGGVWDSALVGSKLVDCGSGGVRVGVDYTVIPDGDDRSDPRQSGYVSIVGNEIREYGRWNRSGCGVVLFDVGNCRVEDNGISDGFYTGISVGWTWNAPKAHTQNNRIVRNRIRRLGQGIVDDLAGIYVLGGESYGSVIAENDIRDVSRFNYGGWGIYLDSRAGYYLVESNRCENCDDGGFFKNQGVRNVVRGNRFLYGRYTQLGDEPADDDDIVFENNVIVYRAPGVIFRGHIPRISRGVWRNNTYWCENGPVTFGPQNYSLEDLQRFGLERGSVVSDPRQTHRRLSD